MVKEKKAKTGSVIRTLIAIIASVTLVGSLLYIGITLRERQEAREETAVIQEIARPETSDDSQKTQNTPLQTNNSKGFVPLTRDALDKLKEINRDFIAWITIPGTNIDYPIVRGVDNNEYLHKSFSGNNLASGTLFSDKSGATDFRDFNTVVYGHHMKDRTMFQNLTLLRIRDNFDRIRKIYVQLFCGDILEYDISSVYVCHADYDYRNLKYGSEGGEVAFWRRVIEKSLYPEQNPSTIIDRILTLSTCEYDYKDARLVVHARLLKQSTLLEYNEGAD